MHMIILPSSGIESTDYQRLEPTSASPPARYGHSAAVIDDQIYIFGGSDANGLLEEKGRVWVFDTDTNSWSSLDAAVGDVPRARYFAAATASAQPQPEHQRTDENVAPQLPPDPAKMVPEPLTPSTYGTFVVFGGICEDEDRYVDLPIVLYSPPPKVFHVCSCMKTRPSSCLSFIQRELEIVTALNGYCSVCEKYHTILQLIKRSAPLGKHEL